MLQEKTQWHRYENEHWMGDCGSIYVRSPACIYTGACPRLANKVPNRVLLWVHERVPSFCLVRSAMERENKNWFTHISLDASSNLTMHLCMQTNMVHNKQTRCPKISLYGKQGLAWPGLERWWHVRFAFWLVGGQRVTRIRSVGMKMPTGKASMDI